ncbi:hypothetical protein [Polymorphobacter sp. PAMC 29334]|nr:hypothetical protein [Polymorphobacter sp. PAMC 29334]
MTILAAMMRARPAATTELDRDEIQRSKFHTPLGFYRDGKITS